MTKNYFKAFLIFSDPRTVCPQNNFAADIKYHDFITIRRTLPSINHHKNSFEIVFSHLKLIVLLKMLVILNKTLIFGLWPKMKIEKKHNSLVLLLNFHFWP